MEKTFSAFRYLITNTSNQLNLFNKIISKEDLINSVFDNLEEAKRIDWVYRGSQYIVTGIERYENLLFLKFARNIKKSIFKEIDNDISTDTIIEPKFIYIIIDKIYQIILIENNKSLFDKPTIPANIFSIFVKEKMKNDFHEIKIHPLAEPTAFWSTVDEADSIYSLKLEFNAPNMALFARMEAQKILKIIKEDTNIDEVDVALKNSQGNLNVKKSGVGRFIEYIRTVGGEIIMIFKRIGSDKKVVYRNSNNSFTTDIPMDDDGFNDEQKKFIKNKMEEISNLETRK